MTISILMGLTAPHPQTTQGRIIFGLSASPDPVVATVAAVTPIKKAKPVKPEKPKKPIPRDTTGSDRAHIMACRRTKILAHVTEEGEVTAQSVATAFRIARRTALDDLAFLVEAKSLAVRQIQQMKVYYVPGSWNA